MSSLAEKAQNRQAESSQDNPEDAGRAADIRRISDQVKKHIHITFDQTKAASLQETESLLRELEELQRDPNKLDLWDGFTNWSVKTIASSIKSAQDLKSSLDTSVSNKWISDKSRDKWTKRFTDSTVTYSKKEYWIQYQLPHYVDAWKKAAEERVTLTKNPAFKDLVNAYPEYKILQDSQLEKFLDLHFDKRKNLLAEARAAIVSLSSNQGGYYTEAKKALYAAVSKGVLSSSKVGVWLERIFKKGWSAKHIQKFLHGDIKDSLPALVENWTKVKVRFDKAMTKAKERGEDLDARGYPMLSEYQFLDLPFDQRMHYVQELESRLDDAKNIAGERPIFIKIRHAMDSKDWEDAAMLIAEAKADPEISGKDRTRLLSMESYTKKFSRNRTSESMGNVVYAKRRMDTILRDLGKSHSEVAPLVANLARGSNSNRSLSQLRWTVYNNKWCRGRGYLDDNIARKGASKENERLTKQRAQRGEDIGRHDVISYETAGDQYVRKNEKANHKATFRHVNVDDGESLNKTAEWFKREQDTKVLYWTTACFHSKGDPKGETWHNELFTALDELRGLSRTLDTADCVYNGVNDSLSRKSAPSKSYSMAA